MGEPSTADHHGHHGFGDPAFEPQANFDFDDQHNNVAMLNGMGGHQHTYLNSMDGFPDSGSGGAMYGNTPVAGSWPHRYDGVFQSMSHQSGRAVDPSDVWDGTDKQPLQKLSEVGTHGLSYPNSAQSGIIKSRGGTVNESFGNLTPPEDYLPEAGAASMHTKPVLDRSERARNAAMQRHAKAKKSRIAREARSSERDSEDGSDVEVGDNRERYREKNRAAAAKCRAKKKTHVEKVELDARSLEKENTMLKAKVRELRNQHSELRNFALQHNAAVPNCHCAAVHQYNLGKAAELTSTFSKYGPGAGHAPQEEVLSPVVLSPLDYGRDGRHHSFSGATPPAMTKASSRHQSFAAPYSRADSIDHMEMQLDNGYPGFSQC